jgi:hypothetical protein
LEYHIRHYCTALRKEGINPFSWCSVGKLLTLGAQLSKDSRASHFFWCAPFYNGRHAENRSAREADNRGKERRCYTLVAMNIAVMTPPPQDIIHCTRFVQEQDIISSTEAVPAQPGTVAASEKEAHEYQDIVVCAPVTALILYIQDYIC